jgi:hypothetical protein
MGIDVRTLLVVHTVVSLALAVLMVVFWRGHRGTPGLGHWTLGTVLMGVGVLAGGLRGFVPGLISIVGANVVGLVGLAAIWNGIRLFEGRPGDEVPAVDQHEGTAWPGAIRLPLRPARSFSACVRGCAAHATGHS